MSDGMYSEHRRVNPMIREVRRPVPGGAVLVEFTNGDLDNGDLDALVVHARDYLERLLALKDLQPQLGPDEPTVARAPAELVPGDRFWANGRWHTAGADGRGRAALFDVWGDTPVITTDGCVVYLDSDEQVLVAAPSEDVAVAMGDAAALPEVREAAMAQHPAGGGRA